MGRGCGVVWVGRGSGVVWVGRGVGLGGDVLGAGGLESVVVDRIKGFGSGPVVAANTDEQTSFADLILSRC